MTLTWYIMGYKGLTCYIPARQAMEPNKCSKWEWIPWQDVRKWVKGQAEAEAEAGKGKWSGEHLFLPIVNLFRQHPDFDPTTVYGES